MQLPIYQIDAFTDQVFQGNSAAVCPLDNWLPDELLQKIAAENNLSETAYFVKENDQYHIRWFTPLTEIDLCGHATLAAAHVLVHHLAVSEPVIYFQSKSGMLSVSVSGEKYVLDFPSDTITKQEPYEALLDCFGMPMETIKGKRDYLLVYDTEEKIRLFLPDFKLMASLANSTFIISAPGKHCDFVSRFFAPKLGIDEDPVTGSAHTTLIPYWSQRLNKKELYAEQLSARGGKLWCTFAGERVLIAGNAITYMIGWITV